MHNISRSDLKIRNKNLGIMQHSKNNISDCLKFHANGKHFLIFDSGFEDNNRQNIFILFLKIKRLS